MVLKKVLWRICLTTIAYLLIDIYAFQGLQLLINKSSKSWKIFFFILFFSSTILTIASTVYSFYGSVYTIDGNVGYYIMPYITFSYLIKFIVCLFLLANDIYRFILRVRNGFQKKDYLQSSPITRSEFLNTSGWIFAGLVMSVFVKGMFDIDHYVIKRIKIKYAHLPEFLIGKSIIQISDLHTGSYLTTDPLEKAIKMINTLEADYIFFTGDLLNAQSKEVLPFMETLKKLKSKSGIFSVTGNHDHADYHNWESEEEKKMDVEKTINYQRQLGWKLLLDEHTFLDEENQVAVIGVQNISALKNFQSYGNLDKASAGTKNATFRILLSHDPTHWDKEVNTYSIPIDLTMSGHTHGMQFGLNIPGFIKWSPIQYIYKRWLGLYELNGRYLYVNPGLGFIGYPGRVGIMPEITIFELTKN